MGSFDRAIACGFLLAASAFGLTAADFVVLQGGARIELQKPPVRQGDVVLLTRSDGVSLSVRVADIDWKATAAARNTPRAPAKREAPIQAPPGTAAQATRAASGPKARIKLTDADVAHVAEEEPVPGEKKGSEARSGATLPRIPEFESKPILYDFTAAWCPRVIGSTRRA